MRKGKSIIGLKVLSQSDATDLGSVRDLIFDHESEELLALLISEKDLFGLIDAQVVPWNQVRSIGPNAVMVPSADSKIKAHEDARVRTVMNRDTALSGTHILTT
ncbi:MAG TPA: PRC-barrel domain-containing protein, partial [Abditibacteriaceae bacterium]